MNYYDDFYYEPSEFERQIYEFKDALISVVKKEYIDEMAKLREENARLSNIENDMCEKTRELEKQLRDIKFRKSNIKAEVEGEFYSAKIDDVLCDYLEKSEVWYAESVDYLEDKCNLCNDERKLTAQFPDGYKSEKTCECAKVYSLYEPRVSDLTYLKIFKRNARFGSYRRFYISGSYEPNHASRNNYDDYYHEFNLTHIVHQFASEIIELHDSKRFDEKIGFTSEAECKKYCQWLNERENSN